MPLLLAAQVLTAIVLLIHVYIVLLETLLFKTRGGQAFGLTPAKVETLVPAMANQALYNGFLVAALLLGFLLTNKALANAFTLYGLCCVVAAGIVGALTVNRRILFIQALPAAGALLAFYLAY